ncbi:hypothetical protein FY036_02990 [Mesorhizobium microcysteis]|uniref:Uncharacterized protein n=1 Tax=Neoaquamicrobium microcysteis TaxID=2682781 RepID=A0A5D4H405_9HYPH|nr:hypothetical protein [Mesorhizobium microcysteis]TYR35254.1 hypothetical protein FY036_02990 [Mesorhizobium microcysteis]
MNRNALVPIMAVAIVNGIFSPWVLAVFVLYPIWYPAWLPPYAQLVYMASALILSTLTIMVAGIPAALHERLGGTQNPALTTSIWLAGALVLTLPALPNVMKALGLGA